MRRAIIEALTYPRIVMLSQLDAEACPRNLYFDHAFPSCRNCDDADQCRWMNQNDEFQFLAEQPIEKLKQAIDYCIDYIESRVSLDDHNSRRCACESCSWIRGARRLSRQYKHSAG